VPERIPAIIEHQSSIMTHPFLRRVWAMRIIKPIAALASVAAIGCSVFAFGWVGLALLGY
jgi:hypothetical protein